MQKLPSLEHHQMFSLSGRGPTSSIYYFLNDQRICFATINSPSKFVFFCFYIDWCLATIDFLDNVGWTYFWTRSFKTFSLCGRGKRRPTLNKKSLHQSGNLILAMQDFWIINLGHIRKRLCIRPLFVEKCGFSAATDCKLTDDITRKRRFDSVVKRNAYL